MFGQVVEPGRGGVVCLAHAAGLVRFGGLGVDDFGGGKGATCVRSVGGGAFAERGERGGRGG